MHLFRKFVAKCKNSSLVYYIKKLQRLSSEILGGLSYLKRMLLQIPMDSFSQIPANIQSGFNVDSCENKVVTSAHLITTLNQRHTLTSIEVNVETTLNLS